MCLGNQLFYEFKSLVQEESIIWLLINVTHFENGISSAFCQCNIPNREKKELGKYKQQKTEFNCMASDAS